MLTVLEICFIAYRSSHEFNIWFPQQAQQMSIVAIWTQEAIFMGWNPYNIGQAAH